MALKITLKPNERIIIEGAVITNGKSSSDLIIENNVPLLREKNIMSERDAYSPCRRIYFVIQLMYIHEERLETYHDMYWDLVREILEGAPSMLGLIDKISNHILSFDYYQALKMARTLIEYEKEVINLVPECECISSISGG
jgi:flagellar protein FlbT